MNPTPPRLVLWDIDLTLVDLRGLGGRWYTDALLAVTGTRLRELPSFPGRTERAITADILTRHDVEPTDELIQRMWRELVRLSERGRATLTEFGHALPGAALALSTLAGQGVVQSLVTGNLPEIALHKLAAFDLHGHLDLEIGGYGTLSAHRPDLVAHAIAQASEKHGLAFAPEAVAVIGDTPDDVTAALEHGTVAVGVATGKHSADELAEAGAHHVLTDLSDTDAVVLALTGR
ncbi:haloacid dehalogenase-like hydrolase [Amycolatopsis sp. 195334CR]|uniref:HAD family hydrolase n=1 Tax=Amycolatopsis sp. 195334CR TaxID=2814588 RepID=UPI0027DC965D|nr:HAD hydrolase-like protein [Amycolatopsis sp. 195334CR]